MRSSGAAMHGERYVQVHTPRLSSVEGGGYAHQSELALAPQKLHESNTSSPKSSALRPASNGPGSRPRLRMPEEIEQMVTLIDQRVTHVSQTEDARLRMLADQTQRQFEGLQAMRVAREIHEERRRKELRMIESNVMLDINNASQARAEIESKSGELSNQILAEHRQELERHKAQFEKAHEQSSRELGDEVSRIGSILEEHRASRVEYGERIAAGLEAEFHKVQEAIVAEQKLRFEAEATMLKMVEDVCSRMRGEIQQERVEREAVQGKLLGLLEETCHRIETGFTRSGGHVPGHVHREPIGG